MRKVSHTWLLWGLFVLALLNVLFFAGCVNGVEPEPPCTITLSVSLDTVKRAPVLDSTHYSRACGSPFYKGRP